MRPHGFLIFRHTSYHAATVDRANQIMALLGASTPADLNPHRAGAGFEPGVLASPVTFLQIIGRCDLLLIILPATACD